MKSLIVPVFLTSIMGASLAYGSDKLPKADPEPIPVDSHITWHEFKHELSAYSSVMASMHSNGTVTITGHTDSNYEKNQIRGLAENITGATRVVNLVQTD